jgi:chromosome partitioning protein
MKARSGASKQADPYAIPHIRATRWRLLSKYQKPCAFVLSKVKRRTNALDDARIRLNAAGAGRLCPIVIHDREEIPAAFSRGLTVLDIDRAKGADELEGLWLFTKAELGI